MVKYLGSKRLLIPAILRAVAGAHPPPATVLDLFSGTSRVGHALKRAGYRVIANDHNAYARVLAACYVEADAESILGEAARRLALLNDAAAAAPPPPAGADAHWFVRDYAVRARYFTPENAGRIVAVREAIEEMGVAGDLRAVLLAALMEAADRVDSTTGVQMAYLKQWAPRALKALRLRVPEVLPRPAAGPCEAHGLDALDAARRFEADVAYIDPPYNQHSYAGNYHVWETLVRWDRPEVYGAACKRTDVRTRRSRFNSRRECRGAFEELIAAVRAPTLVVSFSDEGFLGRADVETILATRGRVQTLSQVYPRYVGARIGIYNPRGEKVGRVGHLSNTEHLFVVSTDKGAVGNHAALPPVAHHRPAASREERPAVTAR